MHNDYTMNYIYAKNNYVCKNILNITLDCNIRKINNFNNNYTLLDGFVFIPIII
jgi:hypothetical protein